MKVRVSNPMRKYLQEQIPEYKFYLLKMGIDQYRISVDLDIFENESDYSPEKNEMKVLQIVYPSEYYAMPAYLTTRQLNRLFTMSDHTAAGFIEEVRKKIEV